MHGRISNLDAGTGAAAAPSLRPDGARARVVLLQTQAEAAGAQEIARMLGCGLTARGYDVHYGFFFRRTAAYDAQPRTFFCSRERPTSPWQLVRMFAALVRHLRELRPDAVLCFQHYGNVVGTLAARCAGVHTVIANRNSVQSLVPRWADAIDLFLGVIGWFTAVVLNSRAVEQEYGNHPRRYRKRLLRIDHGFERKTTVLSREHARRVFGLPADAVLLGDVARFHPIKNLTAAIRLLPGRDWHLALVGQGAQREKLIDFARSLGVLDRLHLVGELPPSRIGDFLGALDAFVFPSLDETFGLAVVEAAQAGVPVVANDLDVLREVLAVDGAPCALFVDVSDTEAFARAVQRLIKDPDLRTQLQSRAARLTNRYALDAMVRGYADLIEALRRRPASPARPGPGPRHAG